MNKIYLSPEEVAVAKQRYPSSTFDEAMIFFARDRERLKTHYEAQGIILKLKANIKTKNKKIRKLKRELEEAKKWLKLQRS